MARRPPAAVPAGLPILIEGMELNCFRGFKASGPIPLAPLTFMVGQNSSGKSSLASAVSLISQSGLTPFGDMLPRWSGLLSDLGSFEDTVYEHNVRNSLSIGFDTYLALYDSRTPIRKRRFRVEYTISAKKGQHVGRVTTVRLLGDEYRLTVTLVGNKFHISSRVDGESIRATTSALPGRHYRDTLERNIRSVLFEHIHRTGTYTRNYRLRRLLAPFDSLTALFGGVQRVSAGRGDPQRWYSIGNEVRRSARTVGNPSLFDKLEPSLLNLPDDDTKQSKAVGQRAIANVLKQLEIADAVFHREISRYHSVIELRDSVTGVTSNIMELGYGSSQVIPVIRACMRPVRQPLIIEQPEIHLHPKAQGALGELFAQVSRRRQLLIETHSVHVINRARIEVAKGNLRPEHMIILFVARDESGSVVTPIRVDANGEFLDEWPSGFFDERYEDSMELLRLKGLR